MPVYLLMVKQVCVCDDDDDDDDDDDEQVLVNLTQ